MDIKACIFDLDGVIVNTAHFHFKSWRKIALNFGIEIDLEFNEQLKGVSRHESLQIILDSQNIKISQEDFNQALVQKNEIYIDYISDIDKNEILPGVLRFLIQLTKQNIRIALGSASKNARTILEKLELLDFFDYVSDGTNTKIGKPNPEVFLNASTFFGLDPNECIVFEDSSKGIEAANVGGFISIGVGNDIDLPYAQFIIPNFSEIQPVSIFSKVNEMYERIS